MEAIDERPVYETRSNRAGDLIWNVMSVFMFLGIAGVVMAFVQIYLDPFSRLNPFPPPTLAATVFVPSSTPTLEPTPVTPSPLPSDTLAPTLTLAPPTLTATLTEVPTDTPTPGPTLTNTIHSLYPFIQDSTSVISGEVFHAGEGCKLWVAGQALDLQRAPMVGITVQLGGSLNRRTLYQLSLTGTALQYGPAGYEFTITDITSRSTQSVWVQLLDQAGIPLSNRIYFDTFDDCSKNLVLINFRQVR